jgi:O-antigen/teichoic acid export membrane protein
MIDLFRYLCLSQIITSLVAINNFVHTAQGRPQWSLVFNIVLAVIMPISFYFAVRYGMNAILIPWFTTYTIICIFWIYITIRTLNIKLFEYLGTIMNPAIASLLMSAVVMLAGFLPFPSGPGIFGSIIELGIKISAAVICYLFYMWFFDRSIFADMNRLRKS